MSAEPAPVVASAPAADAPALPRRAPLPMPLLLAAPALLAALAWLAFLLDRAPHTAAALWGFPLDDAWIHMVYGRAIALEGGFHYNTGVAETGMTSPLWALLIGVEHLLLRGAGVPVLVLGAKALALLFGVAGAWALIALARACGMGRGGALLAAALFAIDPSLTFSRAAGMEVPLFTALVLVALERAARGRALSAGASLGLAVVARPEGVMLLPVVAVMLVWRARGAARPGWGRLALAALLAVAPALLEMAYCLHATGAPLPNTYYAKYSGRLLPSLADLTMVWHEYVIANLPYFTGGIGVWIALLGAFALLRRASRAAAGVLAAGPLLFVTTVGSRGFATGHFHYWERWLLPALPVLLLAIAAGVEEIARGVPALRRRAAAHALAPGARAAFLAAAGAAALVLLLPWSSVFARRGNEYAWNCQNIEEMNVATGRWIAAHLPPGSVVASCDAGAVRYFGQRTTIDVLGLNSHRLLHAGLHRAVEEMAAARVRWLVVFPPLYSDLLRAGEAHSMFLVRAPHYTVCDAPQDVMVVYAWSPRRDPS